MRCVAVTLAVLCAAPIARAERVSTGASGLRAPDLVVLGRDATVELALRAMPAGARLVTNAGEVEEPRRDGAGLRATLTLPAQRYPQVAIVAVVGADGSIIDWLALPLAGQANTRVTTNPRAEVIVRVAEHQFGPVQADADGIAQVPIVVPPGIAEATSVAKSAAGEREQRVSLGVRPFQRTFALCARSGDRAFVIATERDGTPARDAPAIAVSRGEPSTVKRVSPGLFVVRRTAIDASAVVVRAGFPGEEELASSCELQTPAAGPTALELSIDRAAVSAGATGIRVRITPRYAETARRLDVSSIVVETDAGTVSSPMRGDGGVWTASWDVAQTIGDKRRARIVARSSTGSATARGELDVALSPAEPSALSTRAPQRARGDGRDGGFIAVELRDRFGNLVDGVPVELWRGRERLGTLTSSSAARFVYTAPRTHDAEQDTLLVRAGQVESRAVVGLDPLPGPFELGASAGVVMNFGRVTAPLVRIDARRHLGLLGDRLSVHASAAAYSTAFDTAAMDEAISSRLTVAPLLANVAYDADLGALQLRAGAGAGVAFAWARLSSPSTGTLRERHVVPAATAFVGGARTLGPGHVTGDIAYLHATIDGMLAGRIGGIVATVGYAIDL